MCKLFYDKAIRIYRIKAACLFVFSFFTLDAFSQSCDCKAYYEWLRQTFEENDAGFVHTLEQKGKVPYALHNTYILGKVSEAANCTECVEALREWLSFFRKFHIGIVALEPEQNVISTEAAPPVFKSKSAKELQQLRQALTEKSGQALEGIWTTGGYTILITREKDAFSGYILEAAHESWKPGQLKLSVSHDLRTGIYLMGDHSVEKLSAIELLDNKFLLLDDIVLEKALPNVQLSPEKDLYYKTRFATSPFVEKVNEETLFIRLPSFGLDQKTEIENLILKWSAELQRTKNLIIDIRNNGGGADKTYAALLPFIYTHPIHRNQIEFYASERNTQKWADVLEIPNLPEEERALFTDFVDRLRNNPGGFEKIYPHNVTVIQQDTVYSNPRYVALIINENTASAAEQFILDLKQSRKVKTFGRQTAGALDVANISTLNSPDNKLMLVYATSRYVTFDKLKIDDVGILPDFYIDEAVKEEEWLNFILQRTGE